MKPWLILPIHAAALVAAVIYTVPHLSFYNVLLKMAQNSFLHFLHTTLVMYGLVSATFALGELTLGQMTASEQMVYQEKVYGLFGELILVVSFYPSELEMVNVVYFSIFFAVKSLCWVYGIRAQRLMNLRVAAGGVALLGVALCGAWLSRRSLVVRPFNIGALLCLEYGMLALGVLRTMASLLAELWEDEVNHSFNAFVIVLIYLGAKSVLLFLFILRVTAVFKFPFNTARTLVATGMKLQKKLRLFRAYLRLRRDLATIDEVEIEGICAICTEELGRGKQLRCSHAFHAHCLQRWCEQETTCPICRSTLGLRADETITTNEEVLTAIPVDLVA